MPTVIRSRSRSSAQGLFRPTTLLSYDAHDNVIADCDPVQTHAMGEDWSGSNPGRPYALTDSLCAGVQGATRYTWDSSDPAQPFGKLASTMTPLGYQTTYTYDANGLPLSVTGASIAQNDGSTLTPTQTFTYNPTGTLASYSKGEGTWHLTYDTLHRQTSVIDPDPGNPTTCTWYEPNGQVAATEGPDQHAAAYGSGQCSPQGAPGTYASTQSYDADGNVLTATNYRGSKNEAATVQNWYDAADRLVEVQEPYESALTPGMTPFQTGNENDFYPFPWRTRYLYDLSQDGSVAFDGASFLAYGNLYQTQSYLASPTASPTTAPHWEPINAQAFDALDRLVDKMTTQVCPDQLAAGGTGPVLCAPVVEHTVSTYDGIGEAGLLSNVQNADGITALGYATYDSTGRVTAETQTYGTDTSPYRSYVYDADGRPTAITNAVGTQTWSYDQDGRVAQTVEPTALQNAGVIAYGYYPNGLRSSMQLRPSGSATNYTQSYDYRPDQKLKMQTFAGDSQNYSFDWTYSNAGRMLAFYAPAQAENFSYDSYGRVSGITYPGLNGTTTSNSAYTYDAAGDKLGDTIVSATATKLTPTYAYNLRGEMVHGINLDPNNPAVEVSQQSANGHLVETPSPLSSATWTNTSDWDARTGALLGPDPRVDANGFTTYMDPAFTNGTASYNARGDLTSTVQSRTVHWNGQYGATCSGTQQTAVNYLYDVENHAAAHSAATGIVHLDQTGTLCGSTMPQSSGTNETYAWGPNGHPTEIADLLTATLGTALNGRTINESVHWDGDAVAYTSGSYTPPPGFGSTTLPSIDQVFIGNFAVYQPSTFQGGSKLTVNLRDESGMLLESTSNPWTPTQLSTTDGQYQRVLVSQPRSDGYYVGMTLIQGVRAYDPGSSQWTTPDAYAGDITDPMSQQKYMWNGNNPISYSDPSGYCLEDGCVGEVVVVAGGEALAEATAVGADAVGDTELAGEIRNGVDSVNTAIKRALWQRLEQMNGWTKGWFKNALNENRIADNLERTRVGEAKSMNYVSLTKQIRDYVDLAAQTGRQFILRVWQGTKLSKPLQALVNSGKITLEEIPKPVQR